MSELEFSINLGLSQALEKEAWFKEAIEEGSLKVWQDASELQWERSLQCETESPEWWR